MAKVTAQIQFASNVNELKAQIAGGTGSIVAMKDAVDRTARSLGGEGLFRAAHNSVAAVEQLGGASKLTAAEKERLNTQLGKAIEKYQLLGQTAPQAMSDLEKATRAVEEPTKMTFQQIATAVGAVAGVVTGLAAGIGKLGERGAGVLDVKEHFAGLTAAMGQSADVMVGKLREATLGNISDFELMKVANTAFSQGLVLTSDQMGTVGDVAAVLADRIGGDVATAYETMMTAMATGKDKTLAAIGLNIDAAAATEAYATALGKPVGQLSEMEKKQALTNAILAAGQGILAQSGKAQVDFGDKVQQSRTSLSNFVDKVSEWVATSPSIGAWSSGITAASSTVTAFGLAFGPVSAGVTKLIPLLGLSGLGGAFASLGTVITASVVPALGTAFALLSPFLVPLAAVAAAIGVVYLAWRNWDTIGPIVQNVYNAVKTWLVDKFNAIVESIRAKVDAVTGFFKGMYDKVVGNSYVPDMVTEIGAQFTRLDALMVAPALIASQGVSQAFEGLGARVKTTLSAAFTDLPATIMAAITGGGDVGKAVGGSIFGKLFAEGGPLVGGITKMLSGTLGKTIGGALGSVIPGVGTLLGSMAGELIGPLIGKVGGFFKNLFGGPSGIEVQGRQAAATFRNEIASLLNPLQRAEAGTDEWKKSVIGVRDAFIAAGRTEREALDIMDRLWQAEKLGGDAVAQVIREIQAVMQSGVTPAIVDLGNVGQGVFAGLTTAAGVFNAVAGAPIEKTVHVTMVGNVLPNFDWGGGQGGGEGTSEGRNTSDIFRGQSADDARATWLAKNTDSNQSDWDRVKSQYGFAMGTGGRFIDFGAGTDVTLHGREKVVTEVEGRAESAAFSKLLAEVRELRSGQARQARALEEAMMRAFTYGPSYARAR